MKFYVFTLSFKQGQQRYELTVNLLRNHRRYEQNSVNVNCKGTTRGGAKAPSLSQVKAKQKDKHRIVLILLCFSDLK